MPEVALITVHGMGDTPELYAAGLFKQLRGKLGDDVHAKVDYHAVYYQDVLQGSEKTVWQRVDENSKVHYDALRKFLLFGFGDAAGLENRKEEPDSVYEQAQGAIARTMLAAHAASPGKPVVFLSHSLGCQVLSSYIYDAQKAGRGDQPRAGIWNNIDDWADRKLKRSLTSDEKTFMAGGTCMGWITTGCNIPIFVAAHEEMRITPIARPTPSFKWLNIYDPDDVLGWPLQPLSDSYRELVEDRAINAGQGMFNWMLKSWNPWSHNAYWDDREVLDPLSTMLRQLAL